MDMETELRGTCHFARVNDVIFPSGCSDLFITCSVADIRVWNAALRQELLRIQVSLTTRKVLDECVRWTVDKAMFSS